MDNKLTNDYGEILCEAMSQLVDVALEGLKYDRTIVCTIVDNSNKDNYKYIVSDGSMKFEAYADVNNYANNTSVYVSIPNGDYNMQKKIIGRQVGSNTEPFIYTAPLETIISIENKAFNKQPYNCSLLANDNSRSTIKIGEFIPENPVQGFTRLGIVANFKAWLAPMNAIQGSYGIHMLITGYNLDSNKEQIHQLTLSSKDMYNNPYNLETFFNSEKVFDISKIDKISKIELYGFQDNNFYDSQGKALPIVDEWAIVEEKLQDNIFIGDIKLILGYDQSEFETDSLVLYTTNTLTYTNKTADAEVNKKDIYLRWIHEDEENHFILANQRHIDKGYLKIRWYKYSLGVAAADEYCGAHWQALVDNENKFNYNFIPDVLLAEEQIKVIGLVKVISEENTNIFTWRPCYSNIITFQNESEVISSPTVDAATALTITCKDDSSGNYYIYSQNGKINDGSNGSVRTRELSLYYKGSPLIDLNESGISKVIWEIPKTHSMIILNELFWNNIDNKNNYIITKNNKEYYRLEYGKNTNFNNFIQQYSIRDNWSIDYSNNMVECTAINDNRTYHANFELKFGKSGTTGTDVTLVLNIENNINAIENIQNATIEVGAYLYDANSKLVDLNNYIDKLSFSWKSGGEQFTLLPNGNKVTIQLKNVISNISNNYNILQVAINDWAGQMYDLISFLPIPITANKNKYSYITGAREIIYNHQGNANYSKTPYNLYNQSNSIQNNIKWNINYENGEQGFAPSLKNTNQGQIIQASALYVQGENDKVCIYATDMSTGQTVWSQPILIIQNQYDFSMLNSWDGELTINEENGTILSTMVGAGHKNGNDNTFSGVLMGDVKKGTNTDTSAKTGVYGFDHGVMSFALMDDGTATFGAAGNGQIKIDGNSGTIESANYKTDTKGMSIDLDDGTLIIKGMNKERIKLSPIEPYLKVNSTNNKTLIHIGENSYYLQSDGYTDNQGTKFNLTDGTLDIKNSYGRILLQSTEGLPYLQVRDSNNTNLIYMGNQNYYLQSSNYSTIAGTKFNLSNGTLNINSSNGAVTLTGGNSGAYLQVTTSDNKDLIYMGANNNYYLQSRNYNTGVGTKLDLHNGTFDIKGSNGQLTLSGSDPYFVVKDNNGKELIYMGSEGYYLQSSNLSNAAGARLNLQDGSFNINSTSGKVIIKGGDPYLIVEDNNGQDLIHMGTDGYYLQSIGYEKEGVVGEGLRLDLKSGLLNLTSDIGTVDLSKGGANQPFFKVTKKNRNGTYRELIKMGNTSNGETFFLQSAEYTQLYIKQINGYFIYQDNIIGQAVAIPSDFLDNTAYTSVNIVSGNTITGNRYTFPTTYPTETYNSNGDVTSGTANLSNPRKSYLARLVPIIEVDLNNPGKGLYIDLNNGLINGYDLYLRGMNRSNNKQAVVIDSGSSTTPLTVGDHFKVNWDGTLICDNINYLGTKPNDGQYIININDNFKVTPGGGVSGSSGNFGSGWFGGTANYVRLHSGGGASTTIAGIYNNKIVNTGYNIANMSATIKDLSSSISALNTKLDGLIAKYNIHEHYVNVKAHKSGTVVTGMSSNSGTSSVNVGLNKLYYNTADRVTGVYVSNTNGASNTNSPNQPYTETTSVPEPPSAFYPSYIN